MNQSLLNKISKFLLPFKLHELGRQLDIPESTIQQIEYRYPHSPSNQAFEVWAIRG